MSRCLLERWMSSYHVNSTDLSMIIIPEVRDRRLLITTGLSMLRVLYKPMTIKIDIIRDIIRTNILLERLLWLELLWLGRHIIITMMIKAIMLRTIIRLERFRCRERSRVEWLERFEWYCNYVCLRFSRKKINKYHDHNKCTIMLISNDARRWFRGLFT